MDALISPSVSGKTDRTTSIGFDLKTSLLPQADGSGKFTLGLTSVLVSVNGPDQVMQQKEIIDRAYVEVHYESKSGQSSCVNREMENFIAQVCDEAIITSMHPRTSILINITELHNDGCLSACSLNATTLALLDAGIPMRYMVAASACCIDDKGTIHINPSKEIIDRSIGSVTLVVESETTQLLSVVSSGVLTTEQLNQCILLLTNKCKELFDYFQAYIEECCSLIN